MSAMSWQAFFYTGSDTKHPPFRSTWIDAEGEEDAIRIAREFLKLGQCAELTRPRWEGGHAPVLVVNPAAPEKAKSAH